MHPGWSERGLCRRRVSPQLSVLIDQGANHSRVPVPVKPLQQQRLCKMKLPECSLSSPPQMPLKTPAARWDLERNWGAQELHELEPESGMGCS